MKKFLSQSASMILVCVALFSCQQDQTTSKSSVSTNDTLQAKPEPAAKRLDSTYQAINIGGTDWMNADLQVSQFLNGDSIPEARTDSAWKHFAKTKKPCRRNIGYTTVYNGYAIMDGRGLLPSGFVLPEFYDFQLLVRTAGEKGWTALASYTWKEQEWSNEDMGLKKTKMKGKNELFFNAREGGYVYENGVIASGQCSYWWTSEHGSFSIGHCTEAYNGGIEPIYDMGWGMAVRGKRMKV
ncbi:MAG: FISUMP domain-containing protein [Flavobacteriales bacterium]